MEHIEIKRKINDLEEETFKKIEELTYECEKGTITPSQLADSVENLQKNFQEQCSDALEGYYSKLLLSNLNEKQNR